MYVLPELPSTWEEQDSVSLLLVQLPDNPFSVSELLMVITEGLQWGLYGRSNTSCLSAAFISSAFQDVGGWKSFSPVQPSTWRAALFHVMLRSQLASLKWRPRKACVHFTMGPLGGIRHHAGTFLKLLLHSRRVK